MKIWSVFFAVRSPLNLAYRRGLLAILCAFIQLIPTLVLADYQIELDLRSYNNSGGRRSDTTCCDATIPNTQICFPGDTCDTRLNFNVRNFDTNQMYIDQTKTVGDYDGMDIINFMNCSQLINGQGNPLVFVIDPTTWTRNVSDGMKGEEKNRHL